MSGDVELLQVEADGRRVILGALPGDHIAEGLRRTGLPYELPLLRALEPLPRGAVIDVGAHWGNHSAWWALGGAPLVVAVEPHPDSYRCLQATVAATELRQVVAVNAAIHPTALCVAVVEPPCCARGPGVQRNVGASRVEPDLLGGVEALTLDALVARYCAGLVVGLIKVDVEGGEAGVLASGAATLSRYRPWVVVEAVDAAALESVERALAPLAPWNRSGPYGATPTWVYRPQAATDPPPPMGLFLPADWPDEAEAGAALVDVVEADGSE